MNEVFGKKPVTSREFPVILWAACGTLLHFTPPWEIFCKLRILALGFQRTDDELNQASIDATRKLVEVAENDQLKDSPQREWLHFFLSGLRFSSDEMSRLRADIQDRFSADVKLVVAQEVIDLCMTLKERGYRLGIVSNWRGPLSEILRLQGMLEFFDSIVTSHDVGVSKPDPKIFEMALEDLDEPASKAIVVGDSYATDIIGAKRAHLHAVLYDPQSKQLRALAPEDVSQKVVSLDSLKHNRRLEGIKMIQRISELTEFFL